MGTVTVNTKQTADPVCPVRRVVFFGSFGPPSLTFARSCHATGIAVYLLTPGQPDNPAKVQSSCLAGAAMMGGEMVGKPRGIEAILDYARSVGAEALAAISDAHCLWLAKNRAAFDGVCRLLLPSAECLERMASKTDQIALAKSVGLEVLPTWVIRSASDVAAIHPGDYPVCLRPAIPGAVEPSFKVLMAGSADELLRYIRQVWTLHDAVIAQPIRVLPNLIIHACSREGGDLLSAAAFLVDRKFEGLALRVRPMTMPAGLAEKIARFSREAKLSGVYHFDFLYIPQTSEAFYLEVNVRFGGTTDKVFRLGIDEPADCLRAYGLAGPNPVHRHITSRPVVNKRATLKHFLTTLRRGQEPWDYPPESRLSGAIHSVTDLLLARDSITDFADLKGTLAFHLQGLIQ